MRLLRSAYSVHSGLNSALSSLRYVVALVCTLLFASLAASGQTTPTSIVVSPSNPLINTTQTQQFTAASGNTIDLQGVVQVAVGSGDTCALLVDGTVRCWGGGGQGELGTGSNTSDSNAPVSVRGLSGVTAIASGYDQSCAVLADGTVKCWGYNNAGQLGNGSNTESDSPVTVSGLTGATAIAAGYDFTCAVLSDGTARCWGANGNGQLGNGSTVSSNTPVTVSGISGATAIAAGQNHACAVLSDGTARCWGYNLYGQLGNGSQTSSGTPVTVSGLAGVTAIATGYEHTCALLDNGTVKCWGYSIKGQIGNGATGTVFSTPVSVSNLSGIKAIAAGTQHSCALGSDGTEVCWGSNSFGQLGKGSAADSATPVAVSGLSGGIDIAAGGNAVHSCAVLSDGTVRCWGGNFLGQLGNGSTNGSNTPVAVVGNVLPAAGAKQAKTGGNHSCALLEDGTVQCWGYNGFGELGNGSPSNSSTPVTVSNLTGATAISTGQDHTCALLSDGTVKCWGYNFFGQLGDGSNTNSNTPVAVSGVAGATAITTGYTHSCALLSDGTVKCWGNNGFGQLGNGSNTNSSTPVAVSNLTGATAISGGGFHSCALLADGTVKCWGDNGEGQLGNSSTTNSNTPVTVSNLTGATAISTGQYHTCAVLGDGTAKCWGRNLDGELGNGSNTDSNMPVAVSGLSGAVATAAGSNASCALLANGKVTCWGSNAYGELGNGSNTNSNTAVATSLPLTRVSWSSATTSVATIDPLAGLATPFSASSTGTSLITATFGALSNSTTLTVGIAPAFTSANATTFTTGTLGSFLVTTNISAYPIPSISKTGSLPTGVSFSDNSNGTATLSGTPAANTGGVYPLTFRASNGLAPDATQTFMLTVNQPPAISSANTATFTVGVAGPTFTVTATGFPAPTFSVSPPLPNGLSLTTAGVLSGTPAAGTAGSYTLTMKASNGVAPDAAQTFTLIIDQAPAITSGSSATFKVGVPGSFLVTATGYPAPNISETGTLPMGVALVNHNNGSATLGGTPQVAGTFQVVMKAHNGVGSDATQNFTLTVNKGDSTSTVSGPSTGFFTSGQLVTLTAVVHGGGVTPTGTVKFLTSTTMGYTLGTVSLNSNGVATLTTVLPSGTNYIHIEYSGNANYLASQSATLLLRMYQK